MPQRTRVKWAELRVGLMAIAALTLLGYLIFLLTGSGGFWESTSKVYTYLGDSGDLAAGAPVRLNGIVVGKVSNVALSGSDNPQRVIKVELDINTKFLKDIPVDSQAQIAQGNLLGTKYINITKGRSPQTIKPGAEVPSTNVAEFEDVVRQSYSAVAALQGILTRVDQLLNEVQSGQGTIGKFLVDPTLYDKAVGVVNEGQKLIGALNSNKGTIPKLINDDTLYNDLRGTLARVTTLMDGIEQGQGTVGKLIKDPAMYDDARATIGDLRKAIAGIQRTIDTINSGKGTIGALVNNGDLHDQLSSSLQRMNTLLDKINSGQGTIGLLMNDPSLYQSLNGATSELHGLLEDFRANPKKFLHIKLGLF
ncbi:MAG TPA: MlaD family protein [Bryobacteraceae bacterium]|jgi:phospholipid/cholesterol/gamma-HCH transport system substrate-binding protein|nr:MlaD family protein [Bryobacteraceae bacterium]